MHAIKIILSTCSVQSLNLSSNMISEAGLELIVEDIIQNHHLKSLDVLPLPNGS